MHVKKDRERAREGERESERADKILPPSPNQKVWKVVAEEKVRRGRYWHQVQQTDLAVAVSP